MPDFSPDATPRYVASYRAAGINHSIMLRGYRGEAGSLTESRATQALAFWYNTLAAALADDFTWLAAFYIPQDTNVSVPAATPAAVAGLVPVTSFSTIDKISHYTFAGKGVGGSKTSAKLYGHVKTLDVTPDNVYSDFILLGTESAPIATIVADLNARAFPAVDNSVALWYNRATLKINDAWLRRLRAGSI